MDLTSIKKLNRSRIYQLVYQKEKISKPEISSQLKISLPTVSQCVNELIQLGLVTSEGFFESNGGRKAAIITCNRNIKVALGVDIQREAICIVAINIYGEILHSEKHDISFENNDLYCARVGNLIISFFISLEIPRDALLGVGISIQGLVDNAGTHITFGPILGTEGFSAESIGKYISIADTPILVHDTEASASYALWQHPQIKDALFLVLNRNLGGAVIINGQIHRGISRPSGLIAHMTLIPNGKLCYCGKKGCTESYCSARSLVEGFDEDFQTFFQLLRSGDEQHHQRWLEYLSYLSQALYNYQILMNTEIILSGELSQYLIPEDIEILTQYVMNRMGIFQEYPKFTINKTTQAAPGAALPFIIKFLQEYMQDEKIYPNDTNFSI